eukprot:454383-Rhodomonas_salina.3
MREYGAALVSYVATCITRISAATGSVPAAPVLFSTSYGSTDAGSVLAAPVQKQGAAHVSVLTRFRCP